MPCNIDDINITEPEGPSLPSIPGFGQPFSPKLPAFPFPAGFPENLNEIFNLLSMILPAGIVKPSLNPNFAKDIFDGIMDLLDKFFPFLMMYKFFLPILNMIICIIEVLCAIPNPFKLIRALKRLFRQCIPEFLSLFPIFALIVMLLSLLFLLLALIEYIIAQILKVINMLLRNITAVVKATQKGDESSILAITKKIGILLCSFQNIFVILAIFATIIQIIKDMLKLLFSIPPCDDSNPADTENCCPPKVCPSFIKNNEKIFSTAGTIQYYSQVNSGVGLLPPPLDTTFSVTKRAQTYQLFDSVIPNDLQIIQISDASDITTSPKPVFFPTDVTYSANTPVTQAAYNVDLRLFYNPQSWGRFGIQYGEPRFIKFNNCIVLQAPNRNLLNYDGGIITVNSGVVHLAGGAGFEDNGEQLLSFQPDGITQGSSPATLENFLFTQIISGTDPILSSTDGYRFENAEYTFKINHEVLLGKALITLGCVPTVAFDRTIINTLTAGNSGLNYTLLNNLMSGPGFPDVPGAQQCLQGALDALRLNMSEQGVAEFQAMTDICLGKLKTDTVSAVNSLIGIGVDLNKSILTLEPSIQFTSQKIKVKVQLNEGNGICITTNLPASVSTDIGLRLKADSNFGIIDSFNYDGYKFFETFISSDQAGSGIIKVSFDNKVISEITIPADLSIPPSVAEKILPYSFIFTPVIQVGENIIPVGVGDVEGAPRRDTDDFNNGGN